MPWGGARLELVARHGVAQEHPARLLRLSPVSLALRAATTELRLALAAVVGELGAALVAYISVTVDDSSLSMIGARASVASDAPLVA